MSAIAPALEGAGSALDAFGKLSILHMVFLAGTLTLCLLAVLLAKKLGAKASEDANPFKDLVSGQYGAFMVSLGHSISSLSGDIDRVDRRLERVEEKLDNVLARPVSAAP